jgi:hypothetical protein
MYLLSDEQIDFMERDICARGISLLSLRQSLLDHLCTLAEQTLQEGDDFGQFYAATIRSFYRVQLSEIQEQTEYLLSRRGPSIVINRNPFFGLLFTLLVGPFLAYDVDWLIRANQIRKFSLDIPLEIWGASLVYALFPVLVWLVLFITPERLDPLVPRKSKIVLGLRPFIRILPNPGVG